MIKRLIVATVIASIVSFGCLYSGISRAQAPEPDMGAYQKDFEGGFKKVVKYTDMNIENLELETVKRVVTHLQQDTDRLTLVNYWAAWCGFCYMEFSPLRKLSEDHSNILKIIYVGDTRSGYDEFIRISNKARLPQNDTFYDARNFLRNSMNIRTYPTTLLVSPDGKILYRFEGNGDWNGDFMQKFLKSLYNSTVNQQEVNNN